MQIHTSSSHFSVTDAMRDRVQDRVAKAMNHFQDRIGRIDVNLKDTNGPKGGDDKTCRIDVSIESLCRLSVEGRHEDLYAAIDDAAVRARRAVEKKLLKHRSISRGR